MTLLGRIKRAVNAVLAPLTGHVLAHESVVPSFERFARRLRAAGLEPRTVFDIGVAEGTPWLYEAFPKAKFVLVDPTRESLPHMQRWARELDADIWNFALGAESGSLKIKVRPEIGGSTFFDEIGHAEVVAEYDVPVQRFDSLDIEIERPSLCKIDVQGAECMVIEGMRGCMSQIDVLIVESSFIATIAGGPEFSEVVRLLAEVGFRPYDIVGVTRRPLDQALAQVDLVFVPDSSPLRADRRWAG